MPQVPSFDPVHRVGLGPVLLPAGGREGPPPPWPLPGEPSPAEWDAWRQLWTLPQATVWARCAWTRTLARYCRIMVAAEEPGAQSALLAQVLRLEDQHGIGPKAMRLLLWRIVDDEVPPPRVGKSSARDRIRALGPG